MNFLSLLPSPPGQEWMGVPMTLEHIQELWLKHGKNPAVFTIGPSKHGTGTAVCTREGVFMSTLRTTKSHAGSRQTMGSATEMQRKRHFLHTFWWGAMWLGSLHLLFQNGLSKKARAGDALCSDSSAVSR